MIKIKQGLDLPISGVPEQAVKADIRSSEIAILGEEYIGMRPSMSVREGDTVKKGQILFSDKKNPGVKFTAFASGKIKAVNRGEKRVLQSVVIEVEGDEQLEFNTYTAEQLKSLDATKIRQDLIDTGLWTSFKTRPFSHIPKVDGEAKAIFVNMMDTNPLAANPNVVINLRKDDYLLGLELISKLTDGTVFVCKAQDSDFASDNSKVKVETFAGPHPAGLTGTHIHFLYGASLERVVWSIGYQDVIAIGHFFKTGKLDYSRIISLAGPQVKEPCLVKTHVGANLNELCKDRLKDGENRIISGSVLSGTAATGAHAYLGRYHDQVSVLAEGREKELFGWINISPRKFSLTRTTLSFLRSSKIAMNTSTNGSDRGLMPIGVYERVMPLDILPTMLLRDLVCLDTDGAQTLGALELAEEDLALCSFVCPSKYEFGSYLRKALDIIEKDG